MSVLYLDLHKQFIVPTLLSKCLSLVQSLILASADLNSSINIEDGISLVLLL